MTIITITVAIATVIVVITMTVIVAAALLIIGKCVNIHIIQCKCYCLKIPSYDLDFGNRV